MKSDEHFLDALARLEAEHRNRKPVTARPEALPLAAIYTAPAAYQPRRFYGGREYEDAHVRTLSRSLSRQGNKVPLERILVVRVGRRAYCVDGHHRLQAYKTAGWTAEVPVEWFAGSIREAAQEAFRRNAYDKLPMQGTEKLEAAWRLVIMDDGLSKADIVRLTTVSNGTIGNMRRTLDELKQEHLAAPMEIEEFTGEPNKPPFSCRLTWAQAKNRHLEVGEWDPEKDERIIDDWADRLGKAFGRKWGQQPQLAARAIAKYSPRLPQKLIEAWNEDEYEDEAEE